MDLAGRSAIVAGGAGQAVADATTTLRITQTVLAAGLPDP
jgi:hypothetical protein